MIMAQRTNGHTELAHRCNLSRSEAARGKIVRANGLQLEPVGSYVVEASEREHEFQWANINLDHIYQREEHSLIHWEECRVFERKLVVRLEAEFVFLKKYFRSTRSLVMS